ATASRNAPIPGKSATRMVCDTTVRLLRTRTRRGWRVLPTGGTPSTPVPPPPTGTGPPRCAAPGPAHPPTGGPAPPAPPPSTAAAPNAPAPDRSPGPGTPHAPPPHPQWTVP